MIQARAAVARAPHEPFSIETIKLQAPRPDEVLVRLVATGLCHTDLAVQEGEFPMGHPWVLGHEGAGVIEVVGEEVTGLSVGDRVVLTFSTCGGCRNCQDDHPAYCSEFAQLNFGGSRKDGSSTVTDEKGERLKGSFFGQSSFATYALATARNIVKAPADVSLKHLGPLGCGFLTGAGAVFNVVKPHASSTVAVFGAGAVGCAAIMAAQVSGCRRIIAVDRLKSRLDVAKRLGATHVIDTSSEDLAETLPGFGGVDGAIETTGVPRVIEAIPAALSDRGKLVLLGVGADTKLHFDIMDLTRGRTVTGVTEGDADPQILIPKLIELYREGRFPIDQLIRFYPFEDINQAKADALSGATVKPVLVF